MCKVTYGLAYVLVATFLVQFLLFWICKGAFTDQATAMTPPLVASRKALRLKTWFGAPCINIYNCGLSAFEQNAYKCAAIVQLFHTC